MPFPTPTSEDTSRGESPLAKPWTLLASTLQTKPWRPAECRQTTMHLQERVAQCLMRPKVRSLRVAPCPMCPKVRSLRSAWVMLRQLSFCAAHTKYPLARGLSGQGDMYDAYGFCISSEFAELYKATTRKVYVQYTMTTSVLSSMHNT